MIHDNPTGYDFLTKYWTKALKSEIGSMPTSGALCTQLNWCTSASRRQPWPADNHHDILILIWGDTYKRHQRVTFLCQPESIKLGSCRLL